MEKNRWERNTKKKRKACALGRSVVRPRTPKPPKIHGELMVAVAAPKKQPEIFAKIEKCGETPHLCSPP